MGFIVDLFLLKVWIKAKIMRSLSSCWLTVSRPWLCWLEVCLYAQLPLVPLVALKPFEPPLRFKYRDFGNYLHIFTKKRRSYVYEYILVWYVHIIYYQARFWVVLNLFEFD